MSIRNKIVILMGLVALFFMGAIVIQQDSNKQRTAELIGTIQQDQEIFFNTVTDLQGASLEGFVRDYTFWDEMVSFVQKPNKTFAEESIVTGLTTFDADVVWVYDIYNKLIYQYSSNEEKVYTEIVSLETLENLNEKKFLHFFTKTNNGLLEVRGATIHPSGDAEKKTQPQGYFIVGKLWDKEYIDQLQNITGSTITIYTDKDEAVVPLLTRDEKNRNGTIVFMRTLTNWNNDPLSYISVEIKSPIIGQSYDNALRQIILIIIFSIVFILSLAILLFRFIGRPLSLLSESMRSRNIGIIEGMRKDTSEFGELAKLVLRFSEHEALEIAKAKDDALLLAIGSGIIAADKNHIITLVNTAATEILGFKEEELVGKSILTMIATAVEEKKGVHPIIQAFQKGIRVQLPLVMLHRKNGTEFPALLTIAPVTVNESIIGTVLDIRDITKEREIDKAKTEFVSLVSHELRTPLTLINWFIKRFLKLGDAATKEVEEHYLREISKANERMNELVSSILEVSKLELGSIVLNPESIDVESLVHDVLEEVSPVVQDKKITVSINIQENAKKIVIDKKSIYIIIHNLISNAVKYNETAGSLAVRIAKDTDSFLFSVKNTGLGIGEGDREKIFTKLFRALPAQKQVPDGTGLGLYITKSFVTALQGEIWFESKEKEGATFYVKIPLAESDK